MRTHLVFPTIGLSLALISSQASAQEVLSLSSRDAAAESSASSGGNVPMPSAARADAPGLRFNFRGAPLETVLNYMSQAAGYVIVLETPVKGTVDMWSDQPISRQEALQLLNLALDKKGYAASVQGRNLVVSSKDDAKKRNIPIRTGNDPTEIPANAEMVMQVIPLRHIDATQASHDLAALFPSSASVTANQDSNSLIVTDTQINVRHIVEIIAALDTSTDTITAIRVFRLANADPVEMAQLLTTLFQTPAQTTTPQRPGQFGQFGQFGGFRGFRGGAAGGAFGGGPPTAGAGGAGSGGAVGNGGRASGITGSGRAAPVVAVADPRTYSVVVTAAKDQMPQIAEMVAKLDASSARKQKVFVYTMQNADVRQVENVLKNLFQTANARTTTSTQSDPLNSRENVNTQTTTTSSSGFSLGGNSGLLR